MPKKREYAVTALVELPPNAGATRRRHFDIRVHSSEHLNRFALRLRLVEHVASVTGYPAFCIAVVELITTDLTV